MADLYDLLDKISDPNRVVLNANDAYEHADGTPVLQCAPFANGEVEPDRACLLGWAWYLDLNSDSTDLLLNAAAMYGCCTQAVSEGKHVELVRQAIEAWVEADRAA